MEDNFFISQFGNPLVILKFTLHKFKRKFRIVTFNFTLHLHNFCSYTTSRIVKVRVPKHRTLSLHQLAVSSITDLNDRRKGHQFAGCENISKLVMHISALHAQVLFELILHYSRVFVNQIF